MKSKIKIDLDGQNNPVLKIEVSRDQEDLRDKALSRLIESIGNDSNALFIRQPYYATPDALHEVFHVYAFNRIKDTISFGEHADMMMRFEAETLLAESLGFIEYERHNGVKIWKDSEGYLWRFEKYGFNQLEKNVKQF